MNVAILWASLVAQMVKNLLVMQETWVCSLGWDDSPGEGHLFGNKCFLECFTAYLIPQKQTIPLDISTRGKNLTFYC